jgi:hypothetical protein
MPTKRKPKTPAPAAPAPNPDAWTKWVALSTAILAVCAAIASIKSGGYGGRIQIWTTKEANRWAQYQSKSIKESLRQSQLDSLELASLQAPSPRVKKFIDEKIAYCRSEIARYEGEKKEIQADAEKLQAEQGEFKRHSGMLGQAVMFLQIAITLSSIGALLKQKGMWIGGLALGAGGLGYMVVGLFL